MCCRYDFSQVITNDCFLVFRNLRLAGVYTKYHVKSGARMFVRAGLSVVGMAAALGLTISLSSAPLHDFPKSGSRSRHNARSALVYCAWSQYVSFSFASSQLCGLSGSLGPGADVRWAHCCCVAGQSRMRWFGRSDGKRVVASAGSNQE